MKVATGVTISYDEEGLSAAYLTFPHLVGARVRRTREMAPDILVDFDRKGRLLGIEMLDPKRVTLAQLNRIMRLLQLPPLRRGWIKPLKAA